MKPDDVTIVFWSDITKTYQAHATEGHFPHVYYSLSTMDFPLSGRIINPVACALRLQRP